MIRKAFKMKVYPEKTAEYIQRHNPIWEELKDMLKEQGVYNYSIFLDSDSHFLFGYAEMESEEKWTAIATTEICRKWWKSMADLMETNPDQSPKSTDLKQVFHLE